MGKRKYPGVKPRGNWLELRFVNAQGEPDSAPSGLPVGQEKEAAKKLAAIKRAVAAEREFMKQARRGGDLPTEGVTVRVFGDWWNEQRRADEETEQASDEDRWKLDGYIYKFLGGVLVNEFRTKHGIDFVKWLKKQEGRRGKLGKSTVRSIWSCLHTMMTAAVLAELIPVNPCVLPEKGENALPTLEDKDPDFRDSAVFERWEVELLISDERIPEWRRVLWALRFFTSFRPGEAAAIPWMQWDPRTEVLGKLTLVKAWNTRRQKLGKTKTKRRRMTPVHPTLAKVLAKWKLSGWADYMGRAPTPEDLIIPSKVGPYLRVDRTLEMFREDLVTLGLPNPKRQQYDLRASFLSIAIDDGASPELLRWVMWGARKNVQDGYSRMPWAPVAREVAKLRVDLIEGKVLELPVAAIGGGDKRDSERDSPSNSGKILSNIKSRHPDLNRRPTDYECVHPDKSSQDEKAKHSSDEPLAGVVHHSPPAHVPFTVPLSLFEGDRVLSGLGEAATEWSTARDAKRLRKRLTALLLALEDEGGES